VLAGCGAAVLFRGDVLDELDGLDEQLFAYLDDIDLGLRAHLRGHSGRYVPGAVAAHLGSATLGDPLHPKIISWITRNQILLIIKNYPGTVLLRLLPRILIYQALWAARVLSRGAVLPYMRGMLQLLRAVPQALRDRRRRQRARILNWAEFLRHLRASERQIYDWHVAQERERKSILLRVYFGLFGTP
jgi:GT2 family glycosyltransferase